jgi:hypothetical protein
VSKLFALAAGIVWALAGWRNVPQLAHPQGVALGFIVATTIGLAFLGGTHWRRDGLRAAAFAAAEATATASVMANTSSSSAVNVFVASPDSVVASRAQRYGALDNAPWMVDAQARPDLENDDAMQVALEDAMEVASSDLA